MKARISGILAGALVLMGTGVSAQQTSTNRVAAETDWSVFVESNPTSCWAVSTFKESVNTKDGRVVSVRRGETLLFVSYIPSAGVNGQVSFTGGYDFDDNLQPTLEIGDSTFRLQTVSTDNGSTPQRETEMAWATSAEDDAKIITAMKRGVTAIITARSSRGTTTKDTFSLLGFTASVEEAQKRCQ